MFALDSRHPERPGDFGLLAAAQALEALACLGVETVAHTSAGALLLVVDVPDGLQIGEERLRRQLPDLLARGPADGMVGRDDADELRLPVLGGEALEHVVGVRGEADLQRSDRSLL